MSDRVLKDEWIKDDGSFNPQGSYTISNCMGYMVELDKTGDAARLGIMQDDGSYKVTDWLEIEHIIGEYVDEFDSVIDPNGFNVPLDQVIKIERSH